MNLVPSPLVLIWMGLGGREISKALFHQHHRGISLCEGAGLLFAHTCSRISNNMVLTGCLIVVAQMQRLVIPTAGDSLLRLRQHLARVKPLHGNNPIFRRFARGILMVMMGTG